MERAEFLEELKDVLQRDDDITPDMTLKDMDEWDSLAIMSCMAYFDQKFGIKTRFGQYEQLSTVEDLIGLSAGAVV